MQKIELSGPARFRALPQIPPERMEAASIKSSQKQWHVELSGPTRLGLLPQTPSKNLGEAAFCSGAGAFL